MSAKLSATSVTNSMILDNAFREERSVLGEILATIPYHVFWKDTKSTYLGCNRVFAENVGLDCPSQIVGLTDHDMPWKGAEAEDYRADDAAVMLSGVAKLHIEKTQTLSDGTVIHLETSKAPLIDPSGEIIGVIGIFRDISEKRMMELQVAQTSKLESMGQLAAGIAHEINTPAQFVGDNTEFLKDSVAEILPVLNQAAAFAKSLGDDPEHGEAAKSLTKMLDDIDVEYLAEELPVSLGQSLDGVHRIKKIVQSMKAFSHPGTDEKTPVNINKALENTLTVATNEWRYVADVELNLDEALPAVHCLPGELNQCFLNIIVNAAHAIADHHGDDNKGQIVISTTHIDDRAEVTISDTGGGIPEDIHDKIFEQFFTTKGVGRGTGQGLSIAYSVIVHQHAGSLDFETEVGESTTFRISLPINEEKTETQAIT
ncbi:MAG: ATP-binding protein [Woeseiaceae bacterium]